MAKRSVEKVIEVEAEVSQPFQPTNCLGHCGKKFVPAYKHNHVCPSCTNTNRGLNGKEFGLVGKVKVGEPWGS